MENELVFSPSPRLQEIDRVTSDLVNAETKLQAAQSTIESLKEENMRLTVKLEDAAKVPPVEIVREKVVFVDRAVTVEVPAAPAIAPPAPAVAPPAPQAAQSNPLPQSDVGGVGLVLADDPSMSEFPVVGFVS